MLKNILFYIALYSTLLVMLILYINEGNLLGFFAFLLVFSPAIIAYMKKWQEKESILIWTLILAPVGWVKFFVELRNRQKLQLKNKLEYVCESCNKTFGKPQKTKKLLKIAALLLIYGVIIYLIESIPTNDISLVLPRFILDVTFVVIAIVHILITIFKDSGRGKCPYCGAVDFISINSVKGQNLIKQIKKIKKTKEEQ